MTSAAESASLPHFRSRAVDVLLRHLPERSRREDAEALEEACWRRALAIEETVSKSRSSCATGGDDRAERESTVRSVHAQACRNALANVSEDPRLSNGRHVVRARVAAGEVELDKIPNMTADELAPGHGFAAPRRCRASADAIASDAFECPWCAQRRCVHYELQTRSADEATTIFITCVACGHRWTE